MIVLNEQEQLDIGLPLINVRDSAETGTVQDYLVPPYVDTGTEKGVTLSDIHDENTVQPSQPQTFANPADDFVGFEPFKRDVPREQTLGVISVNQKPLPVTQLEQSQTEYLPDKVAKSETVPYTWNVTGLSFAGVAVLVAMVVLFLYAFRKGGE